MIRPPAHGRTWLGAAVALLLLACSEAAPSPNPASGGEASEAGRGGELSGGAGVAGAASGAGGAHVGGGGGAGGSAGSGGSAGASAVAGAGGVAGAEAGGAPSAGSAGVGGVAGQAGAGGGSASQPVTVWLAGDSTVQTCRAECPCGWGGEFGALFNDRVKVVNSAVGGRSVQTWLYEGAVTDTLRNGECVLSSNQYAARWSAMLDASSGMKPGDYLFIQFGINDGSATCPRHVGTALFERYLSEMAKAAKARGAVPVLLTPVSSIACNGAKARGTRGFLSSVAAVAMAEQIPMIDLHERSVALYDSLGFCPNDANYGAGAVGAFFCEDHTHFEAAGARKIAEVIARALAEQDIPLAAYLKP